MNKLINEYWNKIDGDFTFLQDYSDIEKRLSNEIKITSSVQKTLLFVRDYYLMWLNDSNTKQQFIQNLENFGFFKSLEAISNSNDTSKASAAIYTFGKLSQSKHFDIIAPCLSKSIIKKDYLLSIQCLSELLWLNFDKGTIICENTLKLNETFTDLIVFTVLSDWDQVPNYEVWFKRSNLKNIFNPDKEKHKMELFKLKIQIHNELNSTSNNITNTDIINMQNKILDDYLEKLSSSNKI